MSTEHRVHGTVGSRAAGARVVVEDLRLGGGARIGETVVGPDGRYALPYDADAVRAGEGASLDLVVRVVDDDGAVVATSDVRTDAGPDESVDVVLPPGVVPARDEFTRLTAQLDPELAGPGLPLAAVVEDGTRRDVTFLAARTGWPPAAVGMAALATREEERTGIPAPLHYALYRAGLPAGDRLWVLCPSSVLREVWERAREDGIVAPTTATHVPAALDAAAGLAERAVLDLPTGVGGAAFADLLDALPDDGDRRRFAHLYREHGADPAALWREVDAAFPRETAQRLALDGTLAAMTGNNAALVAKLHRDEAPGGLADLARAGFHRPDRWRAALDDVPVPPDRAGRDAYARHLAEQVRLRAPTAVLGVEVGEGTVPVDGPDGTAAAVADLLLDEHERFELAVSPIAPHVAAHGLDVAADTVAAVQTLQRVLAVSPSPEATRGLRACGVDSALAVAREPEPAFVRRVGADVGGDDAAREIHRRSVRVHHATMTLALTRAVDAAQPPIRFLSSPAPAVRIAEAREVDTTAVPTIENLLGPQDGDTCRHCESIVSPAAYLVDLFEFLRVSPHDPAAAPGRTVLDVLLDRRPDLQHLALSCENTEVPLPYVDPVVEILEHVVLHGSSAGYEGHDVTEGVASADLLASPQFVDDAAYTELLEPKLRFPAALPHDQRLAALRAYLERAELPLAEVLDRLLPAPEARTDAHPWRDVGDARLGLSPGQRAVLTGGPAMITAQELLNDEPDAVGDDALVAGAGSVVRLARRLDLSSTDLVAILRTRFVNPAVVDASRPESALPDGLIVLAGPDGADPQGAPTPFDALHLRRGGPGDSRIRPVDLLRIARFARLRSLLGWSVDRTAAVLTALCPPEVHPSAADDAATARTALDRALAVVLTRLGHLVEAQRLLGVSDGDLPLLLGCFAPLGLDAVPDPAESAYRRLFLRPGVRDADPALALGANGRPPGRPGAHLLDHAPALQAALSLSADELAAIADATGLGVNAPLDLDTVSTVFRHGYLARRLGLPVRDLLDLVELTGLDPFTPLDGPDPAFLRLVRLVQLAGGADRGIARLTTLLRRPATALAGLDVASPRTTVRDVRATLRRLATPAAEGTWSVARVRAALAPAVDATTLDVLAGLLEPAAPVTTPYPAHDPPLPPDTSTITWRLGADPARGLLVHHGPLTPTEAGALAELPGAPEGFADAVRALERLGNAATAVFARDQPGLWAAWRTWADRTRALDPEAPGTPTEVSNALRAVAESQGARVREATRRAAARTALAAALRTDPAEVVALADDATVLASEEDPARPVLDDLAAVDGSGVSVSYWAGTTTDGDPIRQVVSAAALTYGPEALHTESGVASGALSGRWCWYAEPPAPGRYVVVVDTDAVDVGGDADAVVLSVDGVAVPLTATGGVRRSAAIPLAALHLAAFVLRVRGASDRVRVTWALADGADAAGVATVDLGPFTADALVPATAVERASAAYQRLAVLGDLRTGLGLDVAEVAAAARASRHRLGERPWPSALPVDVAPDPDTPAGRGILDRLVDALGDLMRVRALRERWSTTPAALAAVLDTAAGPAADLAGTIASRVGGDPVVVGDALARVGDGRPPSVAILHRAADLVDVTRRLPLPVPALVEAITPAPTAADVGAVRGALRARQDEASWLAWVRPVHDALRRSARDALVAAVVARHGRNPDAPDAEPPVVATPDDLYELLLVDVSMDPCMQTSRIQQAIATVQLFVSRCRLNLERRVAPWAIDPERWELMKRYRLWEANRQVFLRPHHFLDPEIRDDKSPFFRDVESELLSSDVTDQAAAVALGGYLEKLDEVAKLEIAAMHVEERESDVRNPVVHVVGRTAGAKRTYYHRVLDGTWTAWERIPLDIPDNPVLPVVWQGRLLLFWLRTTRVPQEHQPGPFPGTDADAKLFELTAGALRPASAVTLTASLFWSEFYNGRWQSPRTSDPERPVELGATFTMVGNPEAIDLFSRIDGEGPRSTLGVGVLNRGSGGNTWFRLHTTHSLPVRRTDEEAEGTRAPAVNEPDDRQITAGTAPLVIAYRNDLRSLTVLSGPRNPDGQPMPLAPYEPVEPGHRLRFPREAPFFFQDRRNVFYVHPDPELPRPRPPVPGFGRFTVPLAAAPPTGALDTVPPEVPAVSPGVTPAETVREEPGR